jgi:hypothetical protein
MLLGAEIMTPKRSTWSGGVPIVLLVFLAATLVMVGAIWAIGAADSDWGDALAVALMLVLLALVLRMLFRQLREEEPAADEAPSPVHPLGTRRGDWAGPTDHRRVMLVLDAPVAPERLRGLIGDGTAVLVVVPTPRGSRRAGALARETVAALDSEGVTAAGWVGPGEPLAAIEEALGAFDADAVLIAAGASDGITASSAGTPRLGSPRTSPRRTGGRPSRAGSRRTRR